MNSWQWYNLKISLNLKNIEILGVWYESHIPWLESNETKTAWSVWSCRGSNHNLCLIQIITPFDLYHILQLTQTMQYNNYMVCHCLIWFESYVFMTRMPNGFLICFRSWFKSLSLLTKIIIFVCDLNQTSLFIHFYTRSPTHIKIIFSIKKCHNVRKHTLPIIDLKTHKPLALVFSKEFWIFFEHLQTNFFHLLPHSFSIVEWIWISSLDICDC